MITREIYYREDKGKELKMSFPELTSIHGPLLWFNNGLYGVISAEKIKNMFSNMQDRENLPTLDKKKEIGKFYWDEVVIIPVKIAKLLFGE